jgi:cell division septum initiation protein DivIVA
VQIDTSPVPDDADATMRKMQQIQRAANAPAEPSSQDRQIASEAARNERQARAELAEKSQEELGAEPSSTTDAASGANEGSPEKLDKLVPDDSALHSLDQALAAQQQPAAGQFIDAYI